MEAGGALREVEVQYRAPRRILPATAVASIAFWLAVEAVALWVVRGLVLITTGHDFFDTSNGVNRVLYAAVVFGTLSWLYSRMSVEGIAKLSRTYSRRMSDAERELVRQLDADGERALRQRRELTRVA